MSAPSCTKSQPQQRGAGLDFGKDFRPTPPGRKARDMDSAPMPDGKPGQEVPKFKPAALPHWLTAPGRPRSAQPRSCRGHHRTCSSAGSASPPPLCRVGVPHHQTASPAEGSSPSGPPSWRWGESRDPGQPAQGHSDKQGGCWEPPRVRVGAQAPESALLQSSSPLSPPGSLPRTPCSFQGAAREPYSPSRQSTLQFRLTQPEPVWARRPKGSGP